ncbi:cobalt ABC transporter permease [Magnetospirillum sp. UT-4]|uniref:cobalt ABC transporter permease n=1 Tax=Magnetospirillum sp. UT-4 TaxID=2681467 RepID=UPI001382EF42|nr:cobalt ABC transporter permease [Magnetospirillum sp. UT-4]CAA7612076.1 conserved exported hypothetical protein [Magnetospirillum sp. UT-4]
MRDALAAVALLLACVAAGPAQAHKVVASAYAEGALIEGEVGFSSGDMAPAGTLVEVFDPAGARLGETRTDSDGIFRFTPTQAVTHVFRADLGAGHVAETILAAADMPGATGAPAESPAPAAPAGAAGAADIHALVAAAVRDEIKPLRREIAAYKEKNDLQAVLGGIGYIIGLVGLGYYLAARRKLRQG